MARYRWPIKDPVHTVTGILLALFLLALTAAFFHILYISPIAGDAWWYRVRALSNPSLSDLFELYLRGYFQSNPRIGQLPLHLSGYSALATAFVGTSSIVIMVIAAVAAASGHVPIARPLDHIALAVVFIASIIGAGRQIGQMFFYIPYNTNYVFGIALLLTHVSIYRIHVGSKPNRKNLMSNYLFAVLGFVSGLSNEHTVPVMLGAGLIYICVNRFIPYISRPDSFFYAGFIGLSVGYLALYFAPAQNLRYNGIKIEGFNAILTDWPQRLESVFSLLLYTSAPYFVLAVSGTAAIYFWRRDHASLARERIGAAFWSGLMIFAAIGMAATVMASPKLGQRLMFSSYVCLAVSLTTLVWCIRSFRLPFLVVTACSAAFIMSYTATTYSWYARWSHLDAKQAKEIARRLHEGEKSLKLQRYDFDFNASREYIRRDFFSENPQDKLNKLRARFYGAEEILFDKDERPSSYMPDGLTRLSRWFCYLLRRHFGKFLLPGECLINRPVPKAESCQHSPSCQFTDRQLSYQ